MLQTIHDESTASRASSLYCVWIRSQQQSGPALIALWIDDGLHAFEQGSIPEFSAGEHGEVWNEQAR